MQDLVVGLNRHEESALRLKDKVARLVSRLSCEDSRLDEERKVLEDCRKSARNCSEDVIEVMGSLDNLSGLFPEDRAIRKQALAKLDALLEEIDVVKGDLKDAEKDLSEKLALRSKNNPVQAATPTKPEQPVLRLRGNAAPKTSPRRVGHAHDAGRGPRSQEPDEGRNTRSSSPSSASSRSSSSINSASDCAGPQQPRMLGAPKPVREVPVPPQRFWKAMELPLRFRPSEEKGCYLLAGRAPSRLEDVKLELSPGATHLTVSGLHLPTARELEGMQKQISFAGRRIDPEWDLELYAKLSQCKFGYFSETFELPRDVDVSGIEASCDHGALQVIIPKHVRRTRPVQHPFFGGHPFFR